MHRVLMQRLDPEMKEGTILEWLKKEGDTVEKGEPIVQVEGDKVIFEIKAPASGVLCSLLEKGTSAPVGQHIAIVAEKVEDERLAQAKEKVKTEKTIELRASPAARKLAKERGINLAEIRGSGPEGEILKDDVHSVSEKKAKIETCPSVETVETIPLVGMRKTIAERMTASYRTAPHVAITVEVRMDESLKLLETIKKIRNIKVPLSAYLAIVVADTLKHHPLLNAIAEETQIKILRNINVGIAVALDDGLIVPVVHDADKKSLIQIAKVVTDLTQKAKERILSSEELKGGTFTISNLGAFGVDIFTPIINPPQAAIMGVGRIAPKPGIVNGQIQILPMVNLTLIFDHRVTDGAQAARFLQDIRGLLENPYRLLAEVTN